MALASIQPHMNLALRVLVLALVLVFGIALSVACADVFCSSCDSICCSAADRSRPLSRVAQRLRGSCTAMLSRLMPVFALTSERLCSAYVATMPLPASLKVAALRI
jgi:hypothetical protein